MNVVQKLRQMVTELQSARPGDAKVKGHWELAGRLMGRLPVDGVEAQRVCAQQDLAGLDGLVAKLEHPQAAAAPATESLPEIDEAELDRALRAFRKRLKLTRLSDESTLRGRRLTSGRASEIDAIIPPHEFPETVWKALARSGRLKDTGHGFYALPSSA